VNLEVKIKLSSVDLVYPLPVVLVTSSDKLGNDNIITIAFTTNLSKRPAYLGITIGKGKDGKGKYSAKLINETREFAVNIPSKNLLEKIDQCGLTHGNNVDKFALSKLTKKNADLIAAKLIDECPINIECKLVNILDVGSSFFFVGEVLKVHIEEDILLDENEVDFKKLDPVLFTQKRYYSLGRLLGQRGFYKNHRQ
jgi:flavin reductase (DIM6/NTAB) family NADH-FMN oxidoreductase RutF